jgi:hypothetical protein
MVSMFSVRNERSREYGQVPTRASYYASAIFSGDMSLPYQYTALRHEENQGLQKWDLSEIQL